MKTAKEIIEKYWETQNEGDYTKVVDLFSDDAVLEDPIYGTFEGKKEIAKFMQKMTYEMGARILALLQKILMVMVR